MPYKNPEDRKAWLKRNRLRQNESRQRWDLRNPDYVSPSEVKRREESCARRRIAECKREFNRTAKASQAKFRVDVMAILKDYCMKCDRMVGSVDMPKKWRVCRKCRRAINQEKLPQVRAYHAAYNRERMATDAAFKCATRIRQRITKAIKLHGRGASKTGSSLLYLGCSGEQASIYLEAAFVTGMSWENYGKEWHIDHIIPVASFDLTLESEKHKAFHFTNLQPLWAIDNMRKGAKVPSTPHQPMFLGL